MLRRHGRFVVWVPVLGFVLATTAPATAADGASVPVAKAPSAKAAPEKAAPEKAAADKATAAKAAAPKPAASKMMTTTPEGKSISDSPYANGPPAITGGFTDTTQGGTKTSGDFPVIPRQDGGPLAPPAH